jgi:hypothetical protein
MSLTILCLSLAAWAQPAAVVADQNPILSGQAATLRWYFTGKKVVVSGGRFGKGTAVTGRTSLTDHPKKTTRYTFDVWYDPAQSAAQASSTANKLVHTRYNVVVQVIPGPSLASYQASRGWQINYLRGWKADPVTTPQVGKNGLVYFQQEDDAVERMAVAMIPAQDLTTDGLMQKITADMAEKYDNPQIIKQEEITYRTYPALWVTFTGASRAHDGTRTQSVILAFIHNGQAYVISARTTAARFKQRQPVLEAMVKSLMPSKAVLNARTASGG